MKLAPLLLAGSLVLNAALVAVIGVGTSRDTEAASRAPSTSAAPAIEKVGAALVAETWDRLRADDPAAQRDRLAAEGFPPSVTRAILIVQIHESFAARRAALEDAQADRPFWKMAASDSKIAAQLRALSQEQQKALATLLGPDPDNSAAASLRRQFPNLAGDKVDQLVAIRERYDERQATARGSGMMTPDTREKVVALDKAMHAEFAATLTPGELEDYDLRTSQTANGLRYNLTAFDASEAEFRALYKLQAPFDEQYAFTSGPPSPDQMRTLGQAQLQLKEDIKAALGPDRYADYQRATDFNFHQTSQLVARLELPQEAANQVYAVQQDLQQRSNLLNQDRSLTPDDRTAQRAALNDEAQTKITAVLGARGFEAYKQYGGSWMQMLNPRPMPRN